MTTEQLVQYYASLLILQYVGLPKAYATIENLASSAILPQVTTQNIDFSGVAASGTFGLSYNSVVTSINWNDSASTIQTKLQGIAGLSAVTVAGSIASELLTVTFTGVIPPALLLVIVSDTLQTVGSVAIQITVAETDVTLPLAIQNAFNVVGSNAAQGVQLDVIGKYVGATRSAFVTGIGFVTLDDADFLTLIQLAIVQNSNGSSLYDIVTVLYQFFPNEIFAYDFKNMQMSYLISTSVGSLTLLLLAIQEGFLPVPMAVQVSSIIYAANINNLFGFITYEIPTQTNTTPFNDYSSYQTDWPWLSYASSILI
jgi:hypothetical protein